MAGMWEHDFGTYKNENSIKKASGRGLPQQRSVEPKEATRGQKIQSCLDRSQSVSSLELLEIQRQMLAPPHSLHRLLLRRCWQMLAPPHSLHVLLRRRCWQMLV